MPEENNLRGEPGTNPCRALGFGSHTLEYVVPHASTSSRYVIGLSVTSWRAGDLEVNAARLQVGIVPVDLHRSLVFYRDVLGLPYDGTIPLGEGRALHVFKVGDAVLKLLERPGTPTVGPSAVAFDDLTGVRWVTMDVHELDAAVERCRAVDAHVPTPPHERRPGLRFAVVNDPDGNAIELVERS
jgi:catechol 2,3-dioxygenase-like lactoylglutathione lyase family enzyme